MFVSLIPLNYRYVIDNSNSDAADIAAVWSRFNSAFKVRGQAASVRRLVRNARTGRHHVLRGNTNAQVSIG